MTIFNTVCRVKFKIKDEIEDVIRGLVDISLAWDGWPNQTNTIWTN
jgi:hypothetical protein